MAISIKDPETDSLARELSQLTGESITAAVSKALRDRLLRERSRQGSAALADELLEIGRRCAALPRHDTRSAEEILGYGDDGLPT